jgi:hypothetical protein
MTLCRLAILAFLTMTSAAVALEDTPENRKAQIERYLTAIPPKALFDDIVTKMAERMPTEQREVFTSLMLKNFDFSVLDSAMRAGMLKTFTADELAALADFYTSAMGKSAMGKMGTYMAEVMPAMNAEVTKATEAAIKELKSRQKQ